MSNHTPGPWNVGRGEFTTTESGIVFTRINGPKMGIVATAYAHDRNIDECEANARLIAAAPELLEALQTLKKELWAAGLKLNVRKHFALMAADAQAGTAVARATGQSL